MKRDPIDWLTGIGGRLLSFGRPNHVPLEKAADLHQEDEIWECAVRRARTWITPPNRAPYRPWIILTVSLHGWVLGSEIVESEPGPLAVIDALAKAMCHPMRGSGGRRRPSTIHVDDADLAKRLAPELKRIGVHCRFRRALPEAEEALQALSRALGDEDPIPGLLEAPGVTSFLVKRLFEAAAFFYREAPWRWIDDGTPLEIRYPVDSQTRYAVVMGHGGQVYGLAIYDSTDILHRTYAGTPPDQMMGREDWIVLLYGEAIETPFDDLDAIEAYDLPIAGENAYPFPFQIGLTEHPVRPGKSDVLRLEAALLGIPRFVQDHMKADEGFPRPTEKTLEITTASGEDRIFLRYPVPGFEIFPTSEMVVQAETARAHDRNSELLDLFEQWLHNQDLSDRTIQMHLDNLERFAHRYLTDEGGALATPCPADEADLEDVDDFLADWILYEVDGDPVEVVTSHLASLNRFYVCLRETGQMPTVDSDEIIDFLQDSREDVLKVAREADETTSATE